MCTKANENINCPRCDVQVDLLAKRLIVETCGHKKCRDCFIKEESGCEECKLEYKQNDYPTLNVNITPSNVQSEKQNHWSNIQPMDASKSIDSGSDSDALRIDTDLDNSIDSDKECNIIRLNLQNKSVLGEKSNLKPSTNPYKIEILEDVTLEIPMKFAQIAKPPILPNEVSPNNISKKPKMSTFSYPSHLIVKKIDNKIFFNCTICNKEFKSQNNRRYHLYCDKSLTKPLKCDKCTKTFITAYHLAYHMKTHLKITYFVCKICKKKFIREGSLRKHLRKHNGDFKYICGICGEKFLHKDEIVLHENKHNNILPYKCSECNKSCSTKSNLKQHLLVHADSKKYSCYICEKKFSQQSTLRSHLLVHSKVRDFECIHCFKTFLDQRTLDRHSKTHNDDKSFECPICSIKSSRRDNIQRHIRNLHPDQNQKEFLSKIVVHIKSKSNNKIIVDKTISNENVGKECRKEHNITVDNNIVDSEENTFNVEYKTNTEGMLPNVDSENSRSVIRFAGRVPRIDSPAPATCQQTNLFESSSTKTISPKSNTKLDLPSYQLDNLSGGRQYINDYNSYLPNVEPQTCTFNKELVLEINDVQNTERDNSLHNIQIYRQLLSPYLKPPQSVIDNSNVDKHSFFSNRNDNLTNTNYLECKSNNKITKVDLLTKAINPMKNSKTISDPFEIYRRILRPNHDDDNINIEETNQNVCAKNEKNHLDNCDNKSTHEQTEKIDNNFGKADSQAKEYFAEMHWRKRTSKCFSKMDIL